LVDETYPTFLVTYHFEDQSWSIELPAKSYAEAEARLQRLQWGTVEGILQFKIPAKGAGWFRLLADKVFPRYVDTSNQALINLLETINQEAEAEMLAGKPITGAHHRAIERHLTRLKEEKPSSDT
jgi:hypothetical protein